MTLTVCIIDTSRSLHEDPHTLCSNLHVTEELADTCSSAPGDIILYDSKVGTSVDVDFLRDTRQAREPSLRNACAICFFGLLLVFR